MLRETVRASRRRSAEAGRTAVRLQARAIRSLMTWNPWDPVSNVRRTLIAVALTVHGLSHHGTEWHVSHSAT